MIDIALDTALENLDMQDPLGIYIQQILVILEAEPQEIMGGSGMSVDLERLVFETKINENKLQREIEEKLQTYTTMYDIFPTTVKVRFSEGTLRDICIIDIGIEDYKFSVMVK